MLDFATQGNSTYGIKLVGTYATTPKGQKQNDENSTIYTTTECMNGWTPFSYLKPVETKIVCRKSRQDGSTKHKVRLTARGFTRPREGLLRGKNLGGWYSPMAFKISS